MDDNAAKRKEEEEGDPLLKVRTARYRPVISGGVPAVWGASTSGFTLGQVESMRKDGQVSLCLAYRGTPIRSGEVEVKANDDQVKKYVEKQFKRLWRKGLPAALECLPYGYSAAEIIYRKKGGNYHFDDLKAVACKDAEMWSMRGKRGVVRVKNTGGGGIEVGRKGSEAAKRASEEVNSVYDLHCSMNGRPAKGWWFAPDAVWDRWYGRSVLHGAWLPWRLKTLPGGGGMDALAKWFYRHAYRGYTIRYPDQQFQDLPGQEPTDAQTLARQMMESLKTGADIALSNAKDKEGKYIWEIDSYGEVNGNATDMIEYVRGFLDIQIQRGAGIPDGIITDSGGQGYAGRKIPEDAYYVEAEHIFWALVEVFDDEVVRPCVRLNYGKEAKYKVEPKPLLPQRQQVAMDVAEKASEDAGASPAEAARDAAQAASGTAGKEGHKDSGPGGTPHMSRRGQRRQAAIMAEAEELVRLAREAGKKKRGSVPVNGRAKGCP